MKSLMSCAAALFTLAAISFSPTQAADVLKSGTFVGVDKHASSGPVEIVKDGETVKVVLTSDFKLKDAPYHGSLGAGTATRPARSSAISISLRASMST